MTNVLLIDNYDSFTYNLMDEFEKRDCLVGVYRNDVGMNELGRVFLSLKPDLLVLSPGPASPSEAGDMEKIIEVYHQDVPIFGVCLGHQAVGEVFGGKVVRAPEILHGKTSSIYHKGEGIYRGLENPFEAGRYHSLAVVDLPDSLKETAYAVGKNGQHITMGMRHKKYPIHTVQFHPESILTPHGGRIFDNLLGMIRRGNI